MILYLWLGTYSTKGLNWVKKTIWLSVHVVNDKWNIWLSPHKHQSKALLIMEDNRLDSSINYEEIQEF